MHAVRVRTDGTASGRFPPGRPRPVLSTVLVTFSLLWDWDVASAAGTNAADASTNRDPTGKTFAISFILIDPDGRLAMS